MKFLKIRSLSMSVLLGLVGVFLLLGLFGLTAPVLAQEQESDWYVYLKSTVPVQSVDHADGAPPLRMLPMFTYHEWELTTESTLLTMWDLAGNPVGEGVHGGEVRCQRDNCHKRMELTIDGVEIKYQFRNNLALDLEAGRAVAAGTGTLVNGRQKERFTFTATFQENWDGTVWIRYDASLAEASFIVPRAPGTIEC